MLIKDIYKQGRPVVSFEVFPPKKDDDIGVILKSLGEMAAFEPDFISVTCGAGGGGNRNMTVEIASSIQDKHGVCSLAHMTCIGAKSEMIQKTLGEMKAAGVRNVLALRGDIPDKAENANEAGSYRHAADLIREIRSCGDFCIGAACYPEGHIDCDDLALDTEHLLYKQEAGADFLVTQLFFDNNYFFRFLDRIRSRGVTIPVSAGIMPILSRSQVERMIFLCGASLPSDIIKLLHKYENDPAGLKKAGVEYAAAQIEAILANGADGVHIYTMNKPDVAEVCIKRTGRV